MRDHDILMGRLITEIIYVHSKLMIIDDRSLVGNRDSEICIVINDLEEEDGRFNEEAVLVGKCCSSWRKKIFEYVSYVKLP
ncbi:unnamed protein product [Rotaria sp. Silwood2]|nr:unnamed protein product [Rotaria sp. Silwood2]